VNRRVLRYAWLSIAAAITTIGLKFGAYWLTGSMGLLSDALESLVNLGAGILTLIVLVIAIKPADELHAYGHGKAEYFSSAAEGVLILIAAGAIIHTSLGRVLDPVPLTSLGPGIIVALLASGVNLIVSRILLKASREYDSITLEADSKHLMTDVWTSIGVVAGLTVLIFAPPRWAILDPIIAILLAVNITVTGFSLLRRSVAGLMDRGLPEEEVVIIEHAIRRRIGGQTPAYHGLRTRKSGVRRFIDFHLLLPGTTTVKDSHDLCCRIEDDILLLFPKAQITIHVEPQEEHSSWDGESVGGICDRRHTAGGEH
jgi:cation diffusion facilitator family transporter